MGKKIEIEWVECSGEAHSNAFIDHCMVCMPFWGKYPVCVTCERKCRETKVFYICPTCNGRARKGGSHGI
jgi:hypothetical protein